MNGYKLTNEQKNNLINQWYSIDCFFNPVQDINGIYFIFDEEVSKCINPDFMWVKNLSQEKYIKPNSTKIP